MTKSTWFFAGTLAGAMSLSIGLASVPSKVTDDTAIYQKMTEVQVQKERSINFDSDISNMAQMESKYREKLPINPALSGAMQRIAKQKYVPQGNLDSKSAGNF